MGLDVSFDLHSALEAGAEVILHTEQYNTGYEDEPNLEIFTEHLIKVPGMEYYAQASVFIPRDTKERPTISVRANKWGDSYEPLTQFLEQNNIIWGEY